MEPQFQKADSIFALKLVHPLVQDSLLFSFSLALSFALGMLNLPSLLNNTSLSMSSGVRAVPGDAGGPVKGKVKARPCFGQSLSRS